MVLMELLREIVDTLQREVAAAIEDHRLHATWQTRCRLTDEP